MDNTDRFYIECASAAVTSLFEVRGKELPYISDCADRKYLDPIAFEAYIRTLPGQLWPVEFRNANATINDYLQRTTDDVIIDALNMAAVSLQTLSATYCPDITDKLNIAKREAVVTKNVVNSGLPKAFENDEARDIFEALVAAGYLNSEWQPTNSAKSKTVQAYMGHTIAQLLGLYNWDKIFCSFWGIEKRLSPFLYQATFNKKADGRKYAKEINAAILKAVLKNQGLKETAMGKELLRKYKNQTM